MKYFLYALSVVFITLKLVHVIDWSWTWVIFPVLLVGSYHVGIFCLAVYIKEKYDREEKERQKTGRIKSKWQQRIDEIQAQKLKK